MFYNKLERELKHKSEINNLLISKQLHTEPWQCSCTLNTKIILAIQNIYITPKCAFDWMLHINCIYIYVYIYGILPFFFTLKLLKLLVLVASHCTHQEQCWMNELAFMIRLIAICCLHTSRRVPDDCFVLWPFLLGRHGTKALGPKV